ncbi:hypothetical protein M407DRAFT_243554 [Tulasnella calospora MUT 4182]|uniref:Uncharacterized protein n=1 Tax=Tulasnella calospora MUT 4182 TaxID=1051891 RepID=A0A0C3KZI6_9AGAM|nr:hypothetical protein M407DRAFT_243554 [Tulasnella calospora MUT 4182]
MDAGHVERGPVGLWQRPRMSLDFPSSSLVWAGASSRIGPNEARVRKPSPPEGYLDVW